MQKKTNNKKKKADDFASVAKRLGCDPSMENFDAKLGKIVKAKRKEKSKA